MSMFPCSERVREEILARLPDVLEKFPGVRHTGPCTEDDRNGFHVGFFIRPSVESCASLAGIATGIHHSLLRVNASKKLFRPAISISLIGGLEGRVGIETAADLPFSIIGDDFQGVCNLADQLEKFLPEGV